MDDNENARKFLRNILSQNKTLKIIESQSGISALEIIRKGNIKIILTNTHMPGMSGIEFISEVRSMGNNTPVIFLSEQADKTLAIMALKLRAFDFIEREFQSELPAAVIKALATYEIAISEKFQVFGLSTSKNRILEFLLKGFSNKEIADRINISEQGVKYHVSGLFKKFDATNRTELRDKIWKII